MVQYDEFLDGVRQRSGLAGRDEAVWARAVTATWRETIWAGEWQDLCHELSVKDVDRGEAQ